ncbi:hypothetical protein LTR84_010680 [Exophiala bonariae]|uniref:Aldehyde dehydrogenase domain-containing protein n=1 Tax=Exophiala bonariae TaxID=1690606 RepID=A0AAV9MW39_9EURO|nr:hypothetical protein LTR84_010680 [Exophiala bonariae]
MPTMTDKETGLPVVPLWINGELVTSAEAGTFPVFSAAQNKDVYLAQSADAGLAAKAAESAESAFQQWSNTPAASRRDIINRMKDLLTERKQELIAVQAEETSCSLSWAEFNIPYTTSTLAEIAARVTTACAGELPAISTQGVMGFVFKESIGPVLLIAPWNAGVVLATKSLASILGAGCSVVFKASELCPRTHHLLVELWIEAGVPPGVINVVQCRREDSPALTEALISHKAIRKVEFIGSASVGRIIASLSGKYLKPVLMELGGKCPSIVLDDLNDAQLEEAATKTIRYAFMNHGQVCFSCERIIVQRKISDRFIQLLKQKALDFPQAQGANTRIVSNAYNMLVDAEAKGARFILGKPEYLNETTLAPTLLTDVTKEMTIYDEESFGPSATIRIVEDDDEAIRVANETSYGLDAFVHTRDLKRALSMARRLEVGKLRVNGTTHEGKFQDCTIFLH